LLGGGTQIVVGGQNRLPELPDTPTIDETVPGVINVGWNGLLAPAGTPAPIIDKLKCSGGSGAEDVGHSIAAVKLLKRARQRQLGYRRSICWDL
jgi:hypothetical protein